MEATKRHEEWCHYCPHCGETYFVTKNKSCRICGTEMVETPHEYKLSQENQKMISDEEFKKLKAELFEDVIQKCNEFDADLYENRDQIWEENQQKIKRIQETSQKKKEINLELLNLGIYSNEEITEEEYYEGIRTTPELYYTDEKYNVQGMEASYKKILTDNLSIEEIDILMKLQQGNDIKSIKGMLKFFMIVFIISIIIVFISTIANSGSGLRGYY